MHQHKMKTLLLQRSNNFAWMTDGAASYVGIASDIGPSSILITPENQYIITNNIEAKRLREEEGLVLWNMLEFPWYEGNVPTISKLIEGSFFSDFFFPGSTDCSSIIAPLRLTLDQDELQRFRILGNITGQALLDTAQSIQPGMTEFEISAILAKHCYEKGAIPIVNLIAADERISLFRHPLATQNILKRYVVLVLGARKWGLVASATRFVHFGSLTSELRDEVDSCAHVASAFIKASKVGHQLSEVFQTGIEAYAQAGYQNFWERHHQGGLTGFSSRELLATKSSTHQLAQNQAFAWNPILKETKSEDTYILTKEGPEAVTQINAWPSFKIGELSFADILIK